MNKNILPTGYISLIAYSLNKYEENIQVDEIPLLYNEKLSFFYNAYHNSFLNTDYILIAIQLYGTQTDVKGIESPYWTLEIQMKHTCCW